MSVMIPTAGAWTSATDGNSGTIVRSKNISLDTEGRLTLARKAMVLYSLAEDSTFGTPVAMATDNRYIYVVAYSNFTVMGLFVIDSQADLFSALKTVQTVGQPTLGNWSDVIIFNNSVIVSGSTTVNALAFGQGQTWPATPKLTGLGSNPHPMCIVEHLNLFAIGDGNTVKTYDSGYSLQNTLTIPATFVVTSIRWRHSNLYIGTRNIQGGDAKFFIWNGTGNTAQDGYTVPGCDWVYSMCEYNSSIALVTSSGQILSYTGGGFGTIANFPVVYTPYSWVSTNANASLVGKVANRGMEAIGDKIYINIDGSLNNAAGFGIGSYLHDQPSGLWVFDPKKGLHHRAGANYKTMLRLTPTEVDSSYLVFSTAHQAQTGDPVYAVTSLTGLISGDTVYYAIVDSGASPTTCRLALSPADAFAGRYIAITGTPTTDAFTFDRYESFGHNVVNDIGCLCILRRARLNSFYGSAVMFGASVLDETMTAKGALMTLGMGRNRGNFITGQIPSAGVLDTIQRLTAYFDSLRLPTDQILAKYRTATRFGLPTPLALTGSATWTSPTTFTVDTTTHDVKSMVVGDEIEVVKGAGAGYLAHITTIDTSSTTYTVTIDETMPISSGSFDFVADNWTKLSTFTNSSENNSRNFGRQQIDGPDARWVQLKLELRGRDIDFDALALTSVLKQPL